MKFFNDLEVAVVVCCIIVYSGSGKKRLARCNCSYYEGWGGELFWSYTRLMSSLGIILLLCCQ